MYNNNDKHSHFNIIAIFLYGNFIITNIKTAVKITQKTEIGIAGKII
jgi:hypothetical protein